MAHHMFIHICMLLKQVIAVVRFSYYQLSVNLHLYVIKQVIAAIRFSYDQQNVNTHLSVIKQVIAVIRFPYDQQYLNVYLYFKQIHQSLPPLAAYTCRKWPHEKGFPKTSNSPDGSLYNPIDTIGCRNLTGHFAICELCSTF